MTWATWVFAVLAVLFIVGLAAFRWVKAEVRKGVSKDDCLFMATTLLRSVQSRGLDTKAAEDTPYLHVVQVKVLKSGKLVITGPDNTVWVVTGDEYVPEAED
jgi:hypothetical protein